MPSDSIRDYTMGTAVADAIRLSARDHLIYYVVKLSDERYEARNQIVALNSGYYTEHGEIVRRYYNGHEQSIAEEGK